MTELNTNSAKDLSFLRDKANEYIHFEPELSLRLSSSNGVSQYYYCDKRNPKVRRYISKDNIKTAHQLATRDYCIKLIKSINLQLHVTNILKKHPDILDVSYLSNVYESLPLARQKLVSPLIISNEQFISQWYETHAPSQNPYPIDSNIFSERGELIRSKSEKIIADLLLKYQIPYVYESPFSISDYYHLYPDFTLLNVRTRKTWIWEHFGLMSDSQYSDSFCKKIDSYQKCNIFIGDGLITTFESQNTVINTKTLEKLIEKYLL